MKRLLSLLLILALTCTLSVGALASDYFLPFPDISEDDWFYSSAMCMLGTQAMTGLPDGTFAPYRDISMIEFCKVAEYLFRPMSTSLEVAGQEELDSLAAFIEQCNPNYWGNDIILDSCLAYGFMDAFEDLSADHASWDAPITRASMCRLLYQVYSHSRKNAGAELTIDPSVYSLIGDYVSSGLNQSDDLPYVLWAYSNGLVGGVNQNGDFNPNGTVTRAEASVIFTRLLYPEVRLPVASTAAIYSASLSTPTLGVDSFGSTRIHYAEDVAYDYARALEERIGMRINYLPEFTEKSFSPYTHADLARQISSPLYFQEVLLELHTLKETLDHYPDGFLKEVLAEPTCHNVEIILTPANLTGARQWGCYVYDDTQDSQKLDQIWFTGTGDLHFYYHEVGHMVMSAAARKMGSSQSRAKWEEYYQESFVDGGHLSFDASMSLIEDWAETWTYLWLEHENVLDYINSTSAASLVKKTALLSNMLLQYSSIQLTDLPWRLWIEPYL